MLAIEVRGLSKTYRRVFERSGVNALSGVDLTIARGIAFGLIGPNGAGKTTFIKAVLGIVRPSQGTVRVLGGDAEDPEIRARIGYLPERLALPHAWSARSFLNSVARLKGIGSIDADVSDKLQRVELADEAGRKIGGFSKGMKQRLGLAAALLGAPDLLILDEPTDGIDPLGRVEVRRILAEERSRGAAILLNSHLLAETERICDEVGILAGGKLVRKGKIGALCESASRYRMRFEPGYAEARLEALGITRKDGDVFVCEADSPRSLNDLLGRAREDGALLVELTRDLRDLEEVLAEAVRT